jgi:hypothetical protein
LFCTSASGHKSKSIVLKHFNYLYHSRNIRVYADLLRLTAMPIHVNIHGLGGQLCTIHAESSWKYRDLKQKIETTLSLETGSFCILYGVTKVRSTQFLQTLPDGSNADLTLLMLELSKQERDSALNKIRAASLGEVNDALQTLQKRVWRDREFVMAVVLRDALMLEKASDMLRADRQIVLAAVHTDGSALKFASDELRADYNIVRVAVRQFRSGLAFASDELRADRDIVLASTYRHRGHVRGIKRCCSPLWEGWFCIHCNQLYGRLGYLYI